MSLGLIRKGLDLIDEESEKKPNFRKKTPKHSNQSYLAQRKSKSAVQSYIKVNKGDQVEKNVKSLLEVDGQFKFNDSAQVVKEHQMKKLNAKSTTKQPQDKKKVEKSVFSENDFEKMNDKWLSFE